MIVTIDMHIRDQRVLEYLQAQTERRISSSRIADVFMCHRHTASAILTRLERAGHIKIVKSHGMRGGFIIEVVK